MSNDKAMYDFANKAVVITGASKGIGKAIAEKFYGFGARVMILDILKEEGEAVVAKLGSRAVFKECDVSDQQQVIEAIAQAMLFFGRIDIMVNNAGVNSTDKKDRVAIDNYSEETWDKMIDIDLNGTFYCCKAAAKVMKRQGFGAIINIASVAGVIALRLQSGFVAAKAGIVKLTAAMACELAPLGIRVNAVSPGSILTDTTRSLFYGDNGSFSAFAEKLLSFIPQGRPGEADEIADVVAFLASGSASYINGQNFVVDGGWTCGFNRDF